MKWMPETESWTGRDKLWHFLGGFAITGVVALVLLHLGLHLGTAAVAGFWVTCTVATLKERRDAQGFGTPSIRDAVATMLGGLLCEVLLLWAL